MDNGFGHFGFASNRTANSFGSWRKIPSGAEFGTTGINLGLDSPGNSTLYSSSSIGTKRKWDNIFEDDGRGDAFLSLGLGRPSSSSDISKGSSTTVCTMSSAKETTDEESSMDLDLNFQLHLGNENAPSPKEHSAPTPKALKTGPTCDLQLSLSTLPSKSVITTVTPVPGTDEEVSAPPSWKIWSYQSPSINNTQNLNSPDASTSVVTQRNAITKTCQFQGCVKGARGASGLCIAHGGGRRCQKNGCHKGAEGKTAYCKAHGGGRRCQFLGCTKSAEGRTDYCIAHGGGRRCGHEGCTRAARGKSGLCIRHGGGKRCKMENCSKSAEGYSGLCISHGGGRRCQFPQCTKGAQGSTMYCKAHGGGKRCRILGCTKGAEGNTPFCKGHGGGKRCSFNGGGVCPKSVHGGTLFCVAHGGGKRCVVPECTKSARGRTDYCVRHGGGKRCKFEGCEKSAQGRTDFCKAHGGGKRCSWAHVGGGPTCDRFARGKTGLCAAHSALMQDRCVHGGGTLGSALAVIMPEELKDVAVVGEVFSKNDMDASSIALQCNPLNIPEGRVHGGSLMAFLSGSCLGVGTSKQGSSGSCLGVGTSKQGSSSTGMHHWM